MFSSIRRNYTALLDKPRCLGGGSSFWILVETFDFFFHVIGYGDLNSSTEVELPTAYFYAKSLVLEGYACRCASKSMRREKWSYQDFMMPIYIQYLAVEVS